MRLSARLEKLETPILERWHKAWEQSVVIFDKHAGAILIDPPDLLDRLQASRPDLFIGTPDDAIEAEGVAFLESLGVAEYRTFETWFNSWELAEDDPPDLTNWPEMIPMPPDEPAGDWQRVAPYMASEDVIEQLAAQLYVYHAGDGSSGQGVRGHICARYLRESGSASVRGAGCGTGRMVWGEGEGTRAAQSVIFVLDNGVKSP